MNWRLIDKSKTKQPRNGKYSDWKGLLAKEGFWQCVYCSIKEQRWGGERNFTVEHYKPKSLFPNLENNIKNLFYACSVCNGFKHFHWPKGRPTNFNKAIYPNPSRTN